MNALTVSRRGNLRGLASQQSAANLRALDRPTPGAGYRERAMELFLYTSVVGSILLLVASFFDFVRSR